MFTTHERSKGKQKQSNTVRKTSGRGYPAPIRRYLERSSLETLSLQEELRAVHDELQSRYEELAHFHSELTALFAGIPVPVVLVGKDLTLTLFNAAAAEALKLVPHDRHSRMSDTTLHGLVNIVAHAIDAELRLDREIQTPQGHWYSLAVRPFTAQNRTPGGALLVWSDIDALYRSRESERALLAEAERNSERTDEVLRHVTAELQTPLEDICGFIALLRTVRMNETEYRSTLETIEDQTDAQRRRIEALLSDARQA